MSASAIMRKLRRARWGNECEPLPNAEPAAPALVGGEQPETNVGRKHHERDSHQTLLPSECPSTKLTVCALRHVLQSRRMPASIEDRRLWPVQADGQIEGAIA